jgi:hypothetical protein
LAVSCADHPPVTRRSAEKFVVFGVDVLDRIVSQFTRPCEANAPICEGILGRREIFGQRLKRTQMPAVMVVLGKHHRDWMTVHRMVAMTHQWEQGLLCLRQVAFALGGDLLNHAGKPERQRGDAAMHRFHLACQPDHQRICILRRVRRLQSRSKSFKRGN